VGVVRRDPMAMLPFCGYNMGDYFKHWLKMPNRVAKSPEIFIVNWFRKTEDGKFMWPGFGENMRILKWMFGRIDKKANGIETVLGYMPQYQDIDWNGLNFSNEQFNRVMNIDTDKWLTEVISHKDFFLTLKNSLPKEFLSLQDENFLTISKLSEKTNHSEMFN
ncbi:MAG: phosphoenolpyruvate carboxykinase domain-containing protein, partial [Pseudobdellovibrio sp.]